MTNEEYYRYMDKPLSEVEKQLLIDDGWVFLNNEYIYIPDDYDGCMAYGIRSIRRLVLHCQHPIVYVKHQGECKKILEEILT